MVFGALIFGFGLAAGFLLAFSGYGLEDSGAVIITVFLALILGLTIAGGIIFLFRKPLMRRLFGMAETQLELFAGPLERVAERAAARDPTNALSAARELLQMSFARYAWISTRRWIIASLTGLIAAMAALSGTALLFKQNQLLEVQSGLLEQQNQRIDEQTQLLRTQVELAEAARNAEIAVEITQIAALLGAAIDATGQVGDRDRPGSLVAVLDPYTDISQSLMMRIISASRTAKPYRFLNSPLRAWDTADKIRVASARRRDDLPGFYAAAQAGFRWSEPPGTTDLIARPQSPERAQLFQTMMRAGLREFEPFNFYGLDLSFAYGEDMSIFGLSMQGAQISYATFARAHIIESTFGGSQAENALFDEAWITRSSFVPFDAETAKGPYKSEAAFGPTFLAGASFRGSFLQEVDFSGIQAAVADFDGATLVEVAFGGASIPGATFRDAVLMDVDFAGADLGSVDFDGAYVLRPDFLDQLAEMAAPGRFVRDRYALEASSIDDLLAVDSAYRALSRADIPQVEGDFRVWRVKRVKPFEQ